MRVLLDQGTPVPLQASLRNHLVETAYERGWSTLQNGDLLERAEAEGFDVLVTTDKNLKYQQKVVGRTLGIVVLTSTSWPRIRLRAVSVVKAVETVGPGGCVEVAI